MNRCFDVRWNLPQRHPTDRRKITVGITDDGHAMLDQIRHWLRASLTAVTDPQLVALIHTLTAIATALEDQAEAV